MSDPPKPRSESFRRLVYALVIALLILTSACVCMLVVVWLGASGFGADSDASILRANVANCQARAPSSMRILDCEGRIGYGRAINDRTYFRATAALDATECARVRNIVTPPLERPEWETLGACFPASVSSWWTVHCSARGIGAGSRCMTCNAPSIDVSWSTHSEVDPAFPTWFVSLRDDDTTCERVDVMFGVNTESRDIPARIAAGDRGPMLRLPVRD